MVASSGGTNVVQLFGYSGQGDRGARSRARAKALEALVAALMEGLEKSDASTFEFSCGDNFRLRGHCTDALPLVTLDVSRFDAAPLIAFTATKETNHRHGKDG